MSESLAAFVSRPISHILETIGFAVTEFEGTTAADLRRALETHQTKAVSRFRATPALVIPSWMRAFFLKKVGYQHPRRMRSQGLASRRTRS
ncbi:MAG: hypothetical protein ACK4VW_07350, partial [Anaerolineales bacterium]